MVSLVCVQKADILGLDKETMASADHFNIRVFLPVIIIFHAAANLPTNGKPDFHILDGKHKATSQAHTSAGFTVVLHNNTKHNCSFVQTPLSQAVNLRIIMGAVITCCEYICLLSIAL